MDLDPTFVMAAEAYLRAVQVGDPREATRQLGAMEPTLAEFIRAKFRKFQPDQLPPDLEDGDVVQEVLTRLSSKPPNQDLTGSAAARVLAWVRTTTLRYLIDQSRLTLEQAFESDEDCAPVEVDSLPAPGIDADERLVNAGRLQAARAVLAETYPTSLPIFDHLQADPDATSLEISQAIGKSVANIDQIKCRMRTALARHLSGWTP